MRHAILSALLGAALLAGCGGDDDSGGGMTQSRATNTSAAIQIDDFAYEPTPLTVKAGERISIANGDKAPHTVTGTASGSRFDSGTIKGGANGSVTIRTPGTHAYVCEFHPFMKGEITVER